MKNIYVYIVLSVLILISGKLWLNERDARTKIENTLVQTQAIVKNNIQQIDDMNYKLLEYSKINMDLTNKFNESQKEVDKVQDSLNKHDIDKLLSKKPNLVIKIFNSNTNKTFDEFEEFTIRNSNKSYLNSYDEKSKDTKDEK